MPTNTTQPVSKRPVKKCEAFIVEGGRIRKRWIDAITLHVHGHVARTLSGEKLPDTVMLDTGADQKAVSVLEFFYKELPKVPSQPEPLPWLCGRNAFIAASAVVVFQVGLALLDAVARALNP